MVNEHTMQCYRLCMPYEMNHITLLLISLPFATTDRVSHLTRTWHEDFETVLSDTTLLINVRISEV